LSAKSLSDEMTSFIIAACAPPSSDSMALPTAAATALDRPPASAAVKVSVSASAICPSGWSLPVSVAAPTAIPALNASVSPLLAAAMTARAAPSNLPSQPTKATSALAKLDAVRCFAGRLGQELGHSPVG
jgi:hypothetical protein